MIETKDLILDKGKIDEWIRRNERNRQRCFRC